MTIYKENKVIFEQNLFDIFNIELIEVNNKQNLIRIHYYPYESSCCCGKCRKYKKFDLKLSEIEESELFNKSKDIVNKLLKIILKTDIKYNGILFIIINRNKKKCISCFKSCIW